MAAANDNGHFACSECGHRTGKWMGFCAQCRTQGSLRAVSGGPDAAEIVRLGEVSETLVDRLPTGIGELDRTLGGGLVPGATIVLGGEPGVGKSTLLLQVAGALVAGGGRALVVSAEESPAQVALRARRVEGAFDAVEIVATNDLDEIIAHAEALRPQLVIVDSIQTIASGDVDGMAGGVSQVRECGARLVAFAKRSSIPVVLIGHVTKEGNLAGPRLLEHIVDVVLYMEGDVHSGLRFVRGLKNRFGSTPALGFFEMGDGGLMELPDPTGVLVASRNENAPGRVLFPGIEGRRPVVVEVQALVATAHTPQPRRSVKGIESARLHQVLAVLDRHVGVDVGARDVYVAIVGGVRVREPAADLAVALAVVSSFAEVAIPSIAAWGEVGLTGEVRGVGGDALRRTEVERLGVGRMIAPEKGIGRLVDAVIAAGLGATAARQSPVAAIH
jgi:DNA repair protein RadA/Sms